MSSAPVTALSLVDPPAGGAGVAAKIEDFFDLDEATQLEVATVYDRWALIQLAGFASITSAVAASMFLVHPLALLLLFPAVFLGNQMVDRCTMADIAELGISKTLAESIVLEPYKNLQALALASVCLILPGSWRIKTIWKALKVAQAAKKKKTQRSAR